MPDSANRNRFLAVEFTSLFVAIPITLSLAIPIWIKLATSILGLGYILTIAYRHSWMRLSSFKPNGSIKKWQWVRVLSFGLISLIFMAIYDPSSLFKVVIHDTHLWIIIFFIYTLASVVPQEWLYRHFYRLRYDLPIFRGSIGIIINGLVFSLAHLFLMNGLVLLITFIGGCLFYWSYQRSNSLFAICVEHTFYGFWLFTIGTGDMLAFPG